MGKENCGIFGKAESDALAGIAGGFETGTAGIPVEAATQ